MFGFKRKVPVSAPVCAQIEDFKPMMAWFERYGSHAYDKKRYAQLSILLGVVLSTQAVLLYQLFPLKQTIPYIIRVDEKTGQLTQLGQIASEYTISDASVNYLLSEFVQKMWTLESENAPKAWATALSFTDGLAQRQLKDWLAQDYAWARFKTQNTYRRRVVLESLQSTEKNQAWVRLRVKEYQATELLQEKAYWMRLNYQLDNSKRDNWQINPIGLSIVDWSIQEDTSFTADTQKGS